MTLRQHMMAFHPFVRPARSNADLIRQHKNQHYRFASNHWHDSGHGPKGLGADDRPAGWTTGEDVRMNAPARRY